MGPGGDDCDKTWDKAVIQEFEGLLRDVGSSSDRILDIVAANLTLHESRR
jgi:hypothetical protein